MNKPIDDRGKKAILLVDFQEDFTEEKKGSLAVPGTDAAYIEKVLTTTRLFAQLGVPIYATQDWHPENHMSFSLNNPGTNLFDTIEINGRSQIMWPAHCVQGTAGANIIAEDILFEGIVQKGTDPDFDSYSGFADDGGKKTALDNLLKQACISELFIYGLATDFCVKFTVLDAIAAGYRVHLILDLCRGVAPDTTSAAIQEMRAKGVIFNDKSALISGPWQSSEDL